MDPITQQAVFAAAGAAGGDKVYVDDVFSTTLYDGTEAAQSITTGIDNTDKSLIFIHARGGTTAQYVDPALFDTERGVRNMIRSNGTGATLFDTNSLTSFNNNGFTTGASATTNSGTADFVAWNFKAAPGFFDVVTYTGTSDTATGTRSIPHNLGSTPGLVILKSTSTGDWFVYHRSIGYEGFLNLNSANEEYPYSNRWNQDPDANNFYVNATAGYSLNNQGETYVAYIFAHDDASFGTDGDESIIKCGSYTGGGSTSVEVNLGFEPQWVLIKSADTAYSWWILDNIRGIFPGDDAALKPNSAGAEQNPDMIDLTATGFKTGTNPNANKQGDNFIYMAIRRPNKPPEAATDVFAIDTSDATSPSPPQFTSGFVTDFIIRKTFNGGNNQFGSRLTGTNYMSSYFTTAESSATALTWDFMDGWSNASGVNTNLGCYMFKRAPGFFDVVAYSGTGSVRTVDHNLGAVPELMIVKSRNSTYSWAVYTQLGGRTKYLTLNGTDKNSNTTAGQFWGTSDFTSTQFSLGSFGNTNAANVDYIAYLFASLDGISKIGSYPGTGSAINVDCGFTAGARFVLIKRTDTEITGTNSSGWYVWDTTRGIAAGNDPYWRTDTTDNPVTNTDYIDPLNAGFTVTSSAPAALNASGGTYLFLAIA